MYQFILKSKRLLLGLFLVLIFSAIGQANPNENIPQRTAEMLKMLAGLERIDFQCPEYEALISDIFSNKKYQKQAGPLLNEFFLSEKNFAGKRYFINELGKAGTPAAIKYLGEMLTFDSSSELALMTLQGIPGTPVNKILKNSFSKASSKVKSGIINALGLRQDESSVSFISKFIGDEDPVISGTTISALGKIGTPKATAFLISTLKTGAHPNQIILMEALIANAEQLISNNNPRALEIYNAVLAANPPDMIALASIKGKMKATPGNPVDILKEYLVLSSDNLKFELAGLARNLPASYKTGRELLYLPGISDNEKIRLIMVLAYRNDKSIRDEVLQFIQHEEPAFREAAVHALIKIAEVKDVPLLAELSASRSGREQELAREGLYRLPGREIDSLILQKALTVEEEPGVEYIKAIGERNISAAGVLLQTAKSNSLQVRIESYRTLAKVAKPEKLGQIVELLLETDNNRERQELERTIFMVSTREGQEKANTNEIVSFLDKTSEKEKKSSLISVLGSIKNPADLEVLLKYLDSEETDLQLSAVRALSEWPNAGPLLKFKRIIAETEDIRVKTLALRGCTQIIMNEKNFSDEKKAHELSFGLTHAPNVNEKKLVVSALGRVPSLQSLQLLAEQMENDVNLRPELEAAILNIIPHLMSQDKVNTVGVLKQIRKYTDKQEIHDWINKN